MMRKNRRPHVITITSAVIFIALGLASGTTERATNTEGSSGGQAAQAQPGSTAAYFTGDGGKGMSLGIIVPESQGLNADQAYLPAMVQGVLVSNISKYSGISVLDRVSLDRVIAETLDPTYEDNLDIVSLGHVAQVGHMMTGKIIKTSSGYTLQINVSDTTPNARTIASYSANCTAAQLDGHMAIQTAARELLTQMGVRLTDRAIAELNTTSSQQSISAEVALARGITAQRQGTEVEAMSYYFQAAAFNPSLLEATTRGNVLSTNVSSGNIGNDARNDIQWRRDWVARLTETEQYFTAFFTTSSPSFGLFYSTDLKRGQINYQNETIPLSFDVNLRSSYIWFASVEKALQAVYEGLNKTGRKRDWGLSGWPGTSITNPGPFTRKRKDFTVVFELLNNRQNVIARQSLTMGNGWYFNTWQERVGLSYDENNFQTVTFNAVKADDITDSLTIRIASVNGVNPQTASQIGSLRLDALSGAEFSRNKTLDGMANIKDDRLTIVNGSSTNGSITIDTIWREPVAAIGDGAFRGKGLTTVTIGSGVIAIGNSAFEDNKLSSVTIPNSVITIGNNAFKNNPLTSVVIGNGVTDIGTSAFETIKPEYLSLDDIDKYAWLRSVVIGNSVRTIGNNAFKGHHLTSVVIPDSVTKIGGSAFFTNYIAITRSNFRSLVGNSNPLTSITIGANVELPFGDRYSNNSTNDPDSAFPKNFGSYYHHNGQKAGTYLYRMGWSFTAR